MNKVQGFSIRVHKDTRIGVGLSRTGPRSWQVEELAAAGADAALPAGFLRGMNRYPANITWVAPDESVRSLLVSLPLLKGKELDRAIGGWVSRQEGKPIEDLALSWRPLGPSREKGAEARQDVYTLVMAMADRDEQSALAAALQVKPARILPGFVLLDQLFRLAGPEASDLKGWALVYLGDDENFLTISTRESMLLTRALPQDHSEGREMPQFLQRLATEIERSRFFVRQGSQSPDVQRVIVCGDPAQAGPLAALLNEQGAIGAVHWTAEDLFSWQGEPADPEYLIPLAGAALSLEKPEFNLLPMPRRSLLGTVGRRRVLVGTGALAAALVPLLVIGSVVTARIQAGYLEDAHHRLDQAQADARKAAEVYKTHRLLTAKEACLDWLARDRVDLESLLVKLSAITPDPVMFHDLRIWEGQDGLVRLHIEGDSRGKSAESAQSGYLDFQAALSGVEFLEKFREPRVLEIKTVTNKGESTPRTMFSLDLEIAPTDGGDS